MSEAREPKDAPGVSASKEGSCENSTANTKPTSMDSAAKRSAKSGQEASSHSVQQCSEGSVSTSGTSHRHRKLNKLKLSPKRSQCHVNILVCGGAALGKSTFISNVFGDYMREGFTPHEGGETSLADFERDPASMCMHLPLSVKSENGQYEVFYHIQDTPGFHNNNSKEIRNAVLNFIAGEKEAHLQNSRSKYNDGLLPEGHHLREGRLDRLIDCCLFFISPHSFTDKDELFIAELSNEVLCFPVCAKADIMTVEERDQFQKLIRSCLDQRGITFSRFEEEFETAARLAGLPDNMPVPRPPFAVVSSNTYMEVKGKLEPVRIYSWGTCVITDFRYSDFAFLQDLITTAAFHTFRDEKTARFYSYARIKKDAELAQKDATLEDTAKEKPKEKPSEKAAPIESAFAKAALAAA